MKTDDEDDYTLDQDEDCSGSAVLTYMQSNHVSGRSALHLGNYCLGYLVSLCISLMMRHGVYICRYRRIGLQNADFPIRERDDEL